MSEWLDDCNKPAEPRPKRPEKKAGRRYRHVQSVACYGILGTLTREEIAVAYWAQATADYETGIVRGGYRLIGAAIKLHPRSVQRGATGLQKKGLWKRTHRGKSKADRSTWELLIVEPERTHSGANVGADETAIKRTHESDPTYAHALQNVRTQVRTGTDRYWGEDAAIGSDEPTPLPTVEELMHRRAVQTCRLPADVPHGYLNGALP